ncbi:MAG: hypothetical protein LW720_00285 [Pirellula sp.]|nr:hypothetical protein [Pirellula sp.]
MSVMSVMLGLILFLFDLRSMYQKIPVAAEHAKTNAIPRRLACQCKSHG